MMQAPTKNTDRIIHHFRAYSPILFFKGKCRMRADSIWYRCFLLIKNVCIVFFLDHAFTFFYACAFRILRISFNFKGRPKRRLASPSGPFSLVSCFLCTMNVFGPICAIFLWFFQSSWLFLFPSIWITIMWRWALNPESNLILIAHFFFLPQTRSPSLALTTALRGHGMGWVRLSKGNLLSSSQNANVG